MKLSLVKPASFTSKQNKSKSKRNNNMYQICKFDFSNIIFLFSVFYAHCLINDFGLHVFLEIEDGLDYLRTQDQDNRRHQLEFEIRSFEVFGVKE